MGDVEQALVPRGLYRRGGTWLIDKRIRGIRLYKSLDTPDYPLALERYQREVNRLRTSRAESDWEKNVREMLADQTSWLYKTHARLIRRGRASGKGCTITLPQLAATVMLSCGRCQVTGIPFSDQRPAGARTAPFQPSIDRIDSSRGYEDGNVRVTLLCVNLAMRDWGEAAMIRIAEAMLLKHLQGKLLGEGYATA